VVVPNWNGARWLPGCLGSLAGQTRPPDEIVVVDNGSEDDSLAVVARVAPGARLIALPRNTGFAHAANRGLREADAAFVALVNTDVELAPDWLERTAAALEQDAELAAVACKMVDLTDRARLYDTGDILRRDGVCEQRGRRERDDGRFDAAGDVFAACAGAALYRRSAVLGVGGFDERFFAYLEDVDLGLRLRLAGWGCRYVPTVAAHASEGSSWQLERPVGHWVERNTLLIVLKAFPVRWAPQVAYRQLGWAWHALRERRLRAHLRGALAAAPLVPAMLRERRRLRRAARVAVAAVVPARPIRGRPA
jgi:GT2 family glycosyltransferase